MNDHAADIVIVGGGLAGYAAAMAAAKTHQVVLIEKTALLGGAATLTNVGTLCGFYYRGEAARQVNHPFIKKITQELFNHDTSAKLVSLPQHLHVIAYEWKNLEAMLRLHLKNVTIYTHAEVIDALSSEEKIHTIVLQQFDQKIKIACRAVVDCTGTGNLAQLLRHPMIASESYSSAAQIVRIKNSEATSEYSLTMSMRKAIIKNKDSHTWPKSYTGVSVVPGSLRDQQVDIKIPLSHRITNDVNLNTNLQNEIEEQVSALIQLLLREVDGLARASVDTFFPVPGIRIQQRPEGKYVLTYDDVMTCRKFDDGIAQGTWPIEEWDYEGKVAMEYFEMNSSYDIPARSLQSPVVDNLFFAGKGISVDSKAIASARVTGTCLQTGYAAGMLATATNELEKIKAIQALQQQLAP